MQPRNFGSDLRRRLNEGATLDVALGELRSSGASIVECIVSVRSARGCDLVEAKRLVHFSPVWADVRALNEEMHEELERITRDDA
jgi:ribosomal protein L7/L12